MRKSRASNFSRLHKWHLYVGLFVAVHFVVLSITGIILVYQRDLPSEAKSTEAKQAPVSSPRETAKAYGRLYHKLIDTNPNARLLALFPEDADSQKINARLGENQSTLLRGSTRKLLDLQTGEESVKSVKQESWLLRLHRELLLGAIGKIYVGLIGFLYVFVLVLGLLIYGKFMGRRAFATVRTGRALIQADWHKFLGVVTFGWSLIVGASGTLLAFNGWLIKLFQFTSLNELVKRYVGAGQVAVTAEGLQNAMTSVLNTRPHDVVSYIAFPNTEYGLHDHFLFLVKSVTGTTKLTELLVIDAVTGKINEVVTLPWYLKAALVSEPLHFGDYGGWTLKIMWMIFAVSSLAVVVLGVSSYFYRRQLRQNLTQQTSRMNDSQISNPSQISARSLNTSSESAYLWPALLIVLPLIGLTGSLLEASWLAPAAALALIGVKAIAVWRWRRSAR